MHYYEVAPTKIIRLDKDRFTYSSDVGLDTGSIVLIEVGKRNMIGIVLSEVKRPDFAIKPILQVIGGKPLPSQLIDLSKWLSGYYISHLASSLSLIVPSNIQKSVKDKTPPEPSSRRKRTNYLFTTEQQKAIKQLSVAESGTFLLQGVTGSGKTGVYIELTKAALKNGSSSIILIPEIALTSQIVSEFSNHFKNIFVIHSSLTDSERRGTWSKIINSDEPVVVVGARSALFAPIHKLGLIVLDEAHESSYKQEQAPKYSTLRAATMLGRFHKAKVVFGSATPSVYDRYLAEQQNRPVIRLENRAKQGSLPSSVSLIDMTDRSNFSSHRFLSKEMLSKLEKTLASGKQSLIFHNRRGTASTVLCENCGYTSTCPNCFIPLTLHADNHILSCHICNHAERVPSSCPSCQHADIIFKGFGTKLIESELRKIFPHANIGRFDADNSKSDTLNSRYSELYKGAIDIAIGTQVVAKGLDLPHLRFVGVIQADVGLALPDFMSDERTFQLLSQVVGRVGRSRHKTHVVVQTYQPSHPSIVFGLKQDYESFYDYAINLRKKYLFPPFCHLLKLTCSYKNEASAIKSAKTLAARIRKESNAEVSVLGPTPAFYERQRGNYRWQLIIKSPKREYLLDIIGLLPSNNWQYDLDPSSLL